MRASKTGSTMTVVEAMVRSILVSLPTKLPDEMSPMGFALEAVNGATRAAAQVFGFDRKEILGILLSNVCETEEQAHLIIANSFALRRKAEEITGRHMGGSRANQPMQHPKGEG